MFALAGCKTEGTTGPTQEDFDALVERIEALEAENTSLRAAVEADGVAIAADLATLGAEVDALGSDLAGLSAGAVQRITTDRTMTVPGDVATLQDALASLRGTTIDAGVTLTIQLAAGTYEFADTIAFAHPSGARIQILGNPDDPSAVVLHYTGTGRAIRVRGNAVLGWIDGVTIRGDDKAGSVGIEASDGGLVFAGAGVVVEHFGAAGLRATRRGQIQASGATARFNGEHGFEAVHQGLITAWGATSHDNGEDGFRAWGGSLVVADRGAGAARAYDNGGAGFSARATSAVGAYDAEASRNDAGFVADENSYLSAGSAVATDNTRQGFMASQGSAISVGGSESHDNEVGYAAGPTSSMDAWGGAVATGNADGFQSFGNGYMGLNGQTVTATDNTSFGFNVFWGGWMQLGTQASASGSGWTDYNVGPWSNGTPLGDGNDWGTIWRE